MQVAPNLGTDAPKVKGDGIGTPKSREHKDFAARLAEAMAKQGWTGRGRAQRLAEAMRDVGLSKATSQLVSTWLRGDRMPRSPYADRLPGILGVPAGYLSGADAPKGGAGLPQDERSPAEPRTVRSPEGFLLREVMASDETLRTLVREGGSDYAEVGRISAHQAGQMLADSVARVFKHTFEMNEIVNSDAGRAFAIAFLERVVEDFGARGLNVTDMARYVIELRRSQGSRGEGR